MRSVLNRFALKRSALNRFACACVVTNTQALLVQPAYALLSKDGWSRHWSPVAIDALHIFPGCGGNHATWTPPAGPPESTANARMVTVELTVTERSADQLKLRAAAFRALDGECLLLAEGLTLAAPPPTVNADLKEALLFLDYQPQASPLLTAVTDDERGWAEALELETKKAKTGDACSAEKTVA
eukprot:2699605-Pyramimonas_sp.AAC.1